MSMRLHLLLLVVASLSAIALAACGDGAAVSEPGPPASPGAGLEHIHGLGVSDGTLFIATHTGLWTAPAGQSKPRRVGSSQQDIMGFSVIDEGRFIGSGHPGPGQTDLPPSLGLIESRDGGRMWTSVSLQGEADFHALESAGDYVYGVNSADGRMMASSDGGRSWEPRIPPAAVFGLTIDPRSSTHVVASTEQGVHSSLDAGETWRPLNLDLAGLLAWPAPESLYLVGGDGSVQVSADGGRGWKSVGSIGGQPAAFIADGSDLYAALADATVKRSTDGGRTWSVRAEP